MEIPTKLQVQLINELLNEQQRVSDSMRLQLKGSSLHSYDMGRINGIGYAITLIQAWNLLNHGKVVAKPA